MLNWPAVSGATSYNVLRSSTSGGPYMLLNSNIAATGYVDNDLVGSGSTTYYYVVTASNGTGDSGNSPQAAATPTAVADNWGTADIGSVGLTGSSSHAGNIFSISGSGRHLGHGRRFPLYLSHADRRRVDHRPRIEHQRQRPLGQERSDDARVCWLPREECLRGRDNRQWRDVAKSLRHRRHNRQFGRRRHHRPLLAQAHAARQHVHHLQFRRRHHLDAAQHVHSLDGDDDLRRAGRHGAQQHPDQCQHAGSRVCHAKLAHELGRRGGFSRRDRSFVDAVVRCTVYNIKRSTTAGGPYTTIASGILTSNYSDATANGSNPYYYVVTAVNPTGESVLERGHATAIVLGDVNGDGQRTTADMVALMRALANGFNNSPDFLAVADVDGDHAVTNRDIQALITLLASDAANSGGGSDVPAASPISSESSQQQAAAAPAASVSLPAKHHTNRCQ